MQAHNSELTLDTERSMLPFNDDLLIDHAEMFRNIEVHKVCTLRESRFMPSSYQPGPHDVVCGRGQKIHKHLGNRRFRLRIDEYIDRYISTKARADKAELLMKVVNEIRDHGGHFILQKSKTKGGRKFWYDIGDKMAREKVGHSFRDANAERRRKRRKKARSVHKDSSGTAVRSKVSRSSSPTPQEVQIISGGDALIDILNEVLPIALDTIPSIESQFESGSVDDIHQPLAQHEMKHDDDFAAMYKSLSSQFASSY